MIKESDLQIGDILLYRGRGLVGWLIRTKTWSAVGHVEVYVGNGISVTATSKSGANYYPLDLNQSRLYCVRRPIPPFRLQKAIRWFAADAKGLPYDVWGLVGSFFLRHQNRDDRKMFCSEVCTSLLRAGGVELFDPKLPADAVSPAQFMQTNDAVTIWSADA